MFICSAQTLPHMTLSAFPTTASKSLAHTAKWDQQLIPTNWNRHSCVRPCPGSPAAQPKLISIRSAAGGANHTSLLKWSIFRKRLNEVTVSRGERLKWKNANIRASRHLDFAFHHSPRLHLLISPSNQLGLWVTNPPPALSSHHTHCKGRT